ncbi:MAG: rubredoxin [bacterium]|nr:rubredoxin [bacterium]
MKMYICLTCSYIYDPKVGDPQGNIEPGTLFEDLPEDWICPFWGGGTADFREKK